MANLIWDKRELKKINALLKKFDLYLANDNEVFEPEGIVRDQKILCNEVNRLLNKCDKQKVLEVLNRIKEINFDSLPKDYPFTNCLLKINCNEPTEIFVIFYEIIKEYKKTVKEVINDLYDAIYYELGNHKLTSEEMLNLISNEKDLIISLVKDRINKTLSYISVLTEDEIFKNLINSCNININNNIKLGSIWNNEELIRIKEIILKRINFYLNADNELFKSTKGVIKNPNVRNCFDVIEDEFLDLFYTHDIDEINRVFSLAKGVNADPDNKEHYGLIMSLSKIDPTKKEEIFIIFKEISNLFYREIMNFAEILVDSLDTEQVKEVINKLLTSDEISEEELMIRETVYKTLSCTNGVVNSSLFMPLLNKLNSIIKNELVNRVRLIANKKLKETPHKNVIDLREYGKAKNQKFVKNNRSKNLPLFYIN